ncbi:sulfate transporter [Nannochloropsis oceanica]
MVCPSSPRRSLSASIELPEASIVNIPPSIPTAFSSSFHETKHFEKGAESVGPEGHVKLYLRECCLGCIPPHIRRKGITFPPLNKFASDCLGLVSLPYFPWARFKWSTYPLHAPSDVLAGLTVGVMLVPQGMAYAVLSSLPPIYGLYASTIAGYVYSLFGTSGQLTIGPVALVSLFMSETYTKLGIPLAIKDMDPMLNVPAHYHTHVRCEIAAVISLAVALMLCVMAIFRVGSLIKFISPSVLAGFVTGSGVYIFVTQSKHIWGIKLSRDTVQVHELKYLFSHIGTDSNKYSVTIGLTAFFTLWTFTALRKATKSKVRRLRENKAWLANLITVTLSAATLVVIVISTLVSQYLIKSGKSITVIGDIPPGFNTFQFPAIINSFYGVGIPFSKIMVAAIPVTFLTYLESVSVGRKYALVHKYSLDMTQELWALGFGCLFASFFQGYPPGGSFSRTALKHEVGVKTPFANIVTSFFVTLVLCAATSLLKYVPTAVLGSIICEAVISLFEFHDIWRALWVAPVDFLIMIFTFLVTVLYNVEAGLEYGIIASVVTLLLQISRLDINSIGQLMIPEDTVDRKLGTHFRPLDKCPSARQHPAVKVLRLRANLFFGNISIFRDEFYASIIQSGDPIKAVIIDVSGVGDMDLSALSVVDEMVAEMHKQQVKVFIAAAGARVLKSLEAYDLLNDVGGLPLVRLDIADVFWAVLESLNIEEAGGDLTSTSETIRGIGYSSTSMAHAEQVVN